jgi:glycosyltransferase involved in cell wall biosynthesis
VRIGYYIPGWPPGSVPNGIVTALGHLGHQLREMGHEIHYLTPFFHGDTSDFGVALVEPTNVRTISARLRLKWNFERALYASISNGIANAVARLVDREKINVFEIEETHGWANTVIRRVSIPIVVRLHGPWFLHRALNPTESGKRENRHRIEREGEAIRRAAAVTAPSNNVLALSQKFYAPLSCPTQVIPNPIPQLSTAPHWKLDTCDRNLILFVGRFDRHKGADVLLRAFVQLAQKRPTLRLLFVGPDVGILDRNGRKLHLADFLHEVVPAPLRNRIDYRGSLSRIEIESLRTKAYLTAVSSRYETFGNVVIEAMARGCPIVATDAGGISEILENNRNGLIAPVDDVNGFAAAMAMLLDDPSLAVGLGEQAARDCGDKFESRKIAQQTVDFYSSVICAHNRG